MIRYALAALAAIFLTNAASAADVSVYTYPDTNETYIVYSGVTEEGDVERLNSALWTARANGNVFSGDIYLEGPGGDAWVGADLAEIISNQGLNTVVDTYCVSACSLMWLAGGFDRYIVGDGAVYFHFAYTDDLGYLNNLKETKGWFGIQDDISQSSHYFTSLLLKYGVKDPAEFVLQLAYNAGTDSFYVVYADNANEAVGAKVL